VAPAVAPVVPPSFAETSAPSSGNWWAEAPEALDLPGDELDDTEDLSVDLPDLDDEDEEP
jgi:hypothetical protein